MGVKTERISDVVVELKPQKVEPIQSIEPVQTPKIQAAAQELKSAAHVMSEIISTEPDPTPKILAPAPEPKPVPHFMSNELLRQLEINAITKKYKYVVEIIGNGNKYAGKLIRC